MPTDRAMEWAWRETSGSKRTGPYVSMYRLSRGHTRVLCADVVKQEDADAIANALNAAPSPAVAEAVEALEGCVPMVEHVLSFIDSDYTGRGGVLEGVKQLYLDAQHTLTRARAALANLKR